MIHKIFFSYSRTDGADLVFKLTPDLEKQGFDVWVDQLDIRAGSEWDLEVQKALETCDCLLFVETAKSVNSNNVLDEVYYALAQKKKVIPLILRDSKTPFRLQRIQHVDFTKSYEAGLAHLISELKSDITAEVMPAGEGVLLKKNDKPFYANYRRLALIAAVLIIVIAAIIYATNIYTTKHLATIPAGNEKIANSIDTLGHNKEPVTIEPKTTEEKDAVIVEKKNDNKIKTDNRNKIANRTDSKTENNPDNKIVSPTDNDETGNLNETFAGDWQLVDVEPKAQSFNGYLKIEATDEKKVNIKSNFQFYYFKTNDTSFLSVFNGFAGCSTCALEKEMKITAEDIAIASQTYKIRKRNEPGEGKAGDTTMNAGANKSIRATVTLYLINNKTAVIKVQRTAATELSHGLVVQPFVYSFRFTKAD